LAQEFDLHHISAGEVLGQEKDRPGSVYKELIEEHMSIPIPVPAPLTVKLLYREILKARDLKKKGVVIDGFPRSIEQAEEFE
jgi:UMP-CMP kinase